MVQNPEFSWQIDLPTGTLSLRAEDAAAVERYCAFAARANPRRGFLVVSKVLGRHLPTRPADMRAAMAALAERLPQDLPGPVVFLGMAETATALAQGTFAAFLAKQERPEAIYLQTSRQLVAGAQIVARFEEHHSHATSHIVQLADPALADVLAKARSLVIVDDECSTGNTFAEAAAAMTHALPMLEQVHCCCLTDWSDGNYLNQIDIPAKRHTLLRGTLEWQPAADAPSVQLEAGANGHGQAPAAGMRSRSGLIAPEAAHRPRVLAAPAERVLVLGDGEHSYEALLIAEEIEAQGGIAAMQSITRTPALIGHAMQSVTRLSDAYGSGATCYLYNVLAHRPDRIVLASEIVAEQMVQLQAALAEMGALVTVESVQCRYGDAT